MELAGIKYTKDAARRKRYLRIDLDMHEENEALQDFLDLLEIEAAKKEKGEYVTLEEFMKKEYRRRGLKDDAI
ncbi:MAG: hypothetical protein LBF85_09285 [Tannerella sp.]|jgi:hypothetical protein|nr:hypothetical protein [Tannerella sp.]